MHGPALRAGLRCGGSLGTAGRPVGTTPRRPPESDSPSARAPQEPRRCLSSPPAAAGPPREASHSSSRRRLQGRFTPSRLRTLHGNGEPGPGRPGPPPGRTPPRKGCHSEPHRPGQPRTAPSHHTTSPNRQPLGAGFATDSSDIVNHSRWVQDTQRSAGILFRRSADGAIVRPTFGSGSTRSMNAPVRTCYARMISMLPVCVTEHPIGA